MKRVLQVRKDVKARRARVKELTGLNLQEVGEEPEDDKLYRVRHGPYRAVVDNVDYWKNSNQKQRWLATALVDIEPRLNRITGYKFLSELRRALQMELGIKAEKVVAA